MPTGYNLGGQAFAIGSITNSNAFFGFAGNATMTGCCNTATGSAALASNTTGYGNTANGYRALFYNTGAYNTAHGFGALYANTTGFQNTANGSSALTANTTGVDNTAVGDGALQLNTTGSSNTASGFEALINNSTGGGNTASGYGALYNNTTGSNNTALGLGAGPDSGSPSLTNATAIGANAVVSESNSLVLGGTGSYAVKVAIGTSTPSNVLTIGQGAGHAISDGWDTYSSRRFKTNVRPLLGAIEKVGQLQGVTYDRKSDGKSEIGVIAEDVAEVVPEIVSRNPKTDEIQGVDYSRLTALLIEALKSQQAEIEQLKKQLQELAVKQ